MSFQLFLQSFSQEDIEYQKPPQEIIDLVDVPQAPWIRVDSKGINLLMLHRDRYISIADLSEQELKLGGLTINPKYNITSRILYYNNIEVKSLIDSQIRQVKGLPKNAKLTNFYWSPDQTHMAFTNTVSTGVELWVLDVNKAEARKLTEPVINGNIGLPFVWFQDGKSILVKIIPDSRKPLIDSKKTIPTGPIVFASTGGKAQNSTFQDLLTNKNDEFNFEQITSSELFKVDLTGVINKWAVPRMYTDMKFSPDGQYVLITHIEKPFSYLVPYYRFPYKVTIYKNTGEPLRTIANVPLTEELPKGAMAVIQGKREINWREDKPAVVYWVEALDKGDPSVKADFRDEVFMMEPPFDSEGKSILKMSNRFRRIDWGNDEISVAYDFWQNTGNTKTYIFSPLNTTQAPILFSDRNYQDAYNNPGNFVTSRNEFGHYVLTFDKQNLFLIGDGYSDKGQFPFLDKYNYKTGKKIRLYQSTFTDKAETLYELMDIKNIRLLVSIESQTDYPNYFIRDVKNNALQRLTDLENPFKSIQNVQKEVITYKRSDGIDLSATLYLPLGYDTLKKEKMPMILWAYPIEYKDKSSASQNTSNPNRFTYPFYGSMIYWVTQGYVVLDNTAFPIVGEGDKHPNDTFIEQLVDNAKAAIDAVDSLGYIDRNRVAAVGHSYGAFMVANLLTHSDLFAAGIARSGAYNRTLTPFGFQNEERNFWEAQDVYNKMAPFNSADKMDKPLLLIHGGDDNNPGTYTMQSERYYKALIGMGATTRFVILPSESHYYRAKESILHLLWEQDEWLNKYVKNKGQSQE